MTISWLRVGLLTVAVLALIPLTVIAGVGGLLVGLVFILLIALAKAG